MQFSRILLFTAFGVLLSCGLARAATFTIANGDVAALKSAITTANTNDEADTINLTASGTYTLTTLDNTTNGPNGLPVIANDVSGADLTIIGNGAAIQRDTVSGTPDFRILQIGSGAGVIVTGLTIKQGRAVDGSGFPNNAGGGILNDHGTLALTGCTVSNNRAAGISTHNGNGGGIANLGANSGQATLQNCTFSGNSASDFGGGIVTNGFSGGNATVQLSNTILKQGAEGDNLVNLNGTITSQGHNLSSDDGSGFLNKTGDILNTDPKLGPLEFNGGLTKTRALIPGSPAIDKGNSTQTTDQRGYGRNAIPDIGAFEFDGVPPLASRVDALIKADGEASTAFALDDVYQLTPHGAQIERQSVRTGVTAIYQVKVENDTNTTRALGVQAVESTDTGWTIVYKKGTTNISTVIRSANGYKTGTLAPGASATFTIEMTPGSGASASQSSTLRVFSSGGLDTVTRDAVLAITTVTASAAWSGASL